MDRREFIGLCGAAAAGLAAGCASIAARPVTVVDGRITLRLDDHPELAQPDGSIAIRVPGRREPLYVLRTGAERFSVLSPICTHRGCTVDPAGDRLECPCHGSQYDREGVVLRGPAQRPLTRFPATLRDEHLVIQLEASRS